MLFGVGPPAVALPPLTSLLPMPPMPPTPPKPSMPPKPVATGMPEPARLARYLLPALTRALTRRHGLRAPPARGRQAPTDRLRPSRANFDKERAAEEIFFDLSHFGIILKDL